MTRLCLRPHIGESPPKDDPPRNGKFFSTDGQPLYMALRNTQYVQNVQAFDADALTAQGLAAARDFAARAKMQAGPRKIEGGSKTSQIIQHGYFSAPRGGLETRSFELSSSSEKLSKTLRKRAHLIK